MPKGAIILKKIFLLSLLTICWTGVLALGKNGKVLAAFNDQEKSAGNSFIAGPLDFSLNSPQDFTPIITPDESALKNIDLINYGNPFRYKFQTTDPSGDLCNYILLEADLNGGNPECEGPLIEFNCQTFLFDEPGGGLPQRWHFRATLLEGAPERSVCNFRFLFSGWQINLENGGFHDEEVIENSIISGSWFPESQKVIINKVYYDPDPTHGQEEENEWIELYNPNDNPVDISGWIIEDNTSQDVLPDSLIIPARGFALITGSTSTWEYWKIIPDGVLKVVLRDGKIGNGLANNGDRMILKDPFGRIIDQLSYEGDTTIFDPAPPLDASGNSYNLPEGHILGRDPTGYDTDTPQDWHDFALPQVSVLYPSGGTWYCRQRVTLRWQASNPNGPDSALLITLQYIRDLDGNGIVSQGDAITTIAQNISNTGSYSWQVSPCHYGYVWIRVIAQGPENFMVSDSDLSGRVFEPPPEEESGKSQSSGQNPEEMGKEEKESEEISEEIEIAPEENLNEELSGSKVSEEETGGEESKTDQTEETELTKRENVTDEEINATSTDTFPLIDSLPQEEISDFKELKGEEPSIEEDSSKEDYDYDKEKTERLLESERMESGMELNLEEGSGTESISGLSEENKPSSNKEESVPEGEKESVNKQSNEQLSFRKTLSEESQLEDSAPLELKSPPERGSTQGDNLNNISPENAHEEGLEGKI